MTTSDVCRRCAQRGTSCCTAPDGLSLAPLLPAEITRLARLTGLAPEDFSDERAIDEEERAALWADDPVLEGLGADGRLVSLAVREGLCVFLGPNGCRLGDERPLLCRRFPFVRLGARRLAVRPGGQCLAYEEASELRELFVSLGMDPSRLRRLDEAIRRALK